MAPIVPFLLRSAIASIALFVAYSAGKKSIDRNRRRTFVVGLRRKIDQLKTEYRGSDDPQIQRTIEELEALLLSVNKANSDQELDAEVNKFFSGEFFQDLMEGVGDVAEEAEEAIWTFFDSAANALDDHVVEPWVRALGGDRPRKGLNEKKETED